VRVVLHVSAALRVVYVFMWLYCVVGVCAK